MESSLKNISASAIQAYHSRERYLFSRLVLDLQLDPMRSMEIIALWLWLEEEEKTDVIDRIRSFDDSALRIFADKGQGIVRALRLDTPPDQLTLGFHQNAVLGIKYYLNNVCLKAFSDIQRKAEEMESLRMEMLAHQMSCMRLNSSDRGQMIPSLTYGMNCTETTRALGALPYVPYGEGTSRSTHATLQPLHVVDVESRIQSEYLFSPSILGSTPWTQQFTQIGHALPIVTHSTGYDSNGIMYDGHNHARTEFQQPSISNIPMEERTLFVTFSNGYPLTEEELYSFFMRNFGDVELVSIQKPREGKPPQYAYVSFRSLLTVFRVLNGSEKAKFMTNGKHLWARRFIPKRNVHSDLKRILYLKHA